MFCFRIRKRLVPYSEGTLSHREAEKVAVHLSRCRRCSDELRIIKSASCAFRSAKTPAMEPAPDLWSRIEREIAAPEPVAHHWHIRSLQYGGAIAAAAILLFAVMNISDLSRTGGSVGRKETPIPSEGSIKPSTARKAQPPESAGSAIVPKAQGDVKSSLPTVKTSPMKGMHITGLPASPTRPTRTEVSHSPMIVDSPHAGRRPVTRGSVDEPEGNYEAIKPPPGTFRDTTVLADIDGSRAGGNDLAVHNEVIASGPVVSEGLAGPPGPIGTGMVENNLAGTLRFGGAAGNVTNWYNYTAGRFGSVAVPESANVLIARKPRSFEAPVTSVDLLNQADDQSRNLALFSYP